MERLVLSEIRNIVFGGGEFAIWRKFREEMLRKPLGLSLSNDDIAAEVNDFHICLFIEKEECTLYTPEAYRVQFRRISHRWLDFEQTARCINFQNATGRSSAGISKPGIRSRPGTVF